MGRGKFKGKPTGRRQFSTPEEMRLILQAAHQADFRTSKPTILCGGAVLSRVQVAACARPSAPFLGLRLAATGQLGTYLMNIMLQPISNLPMFDRSSICLQELHSCSGRMRRNATVAHSESMLIRLHSVL